MDRTKTIGGVLIAGLMLAALTTLTLGVMDHTDEGLLNEQQEQIGFVDLEPADERSTAPDTGQQDESDISSRGSVTDPV